MVVGDSREGIASFLAPLKRCKKEAVLWLFRNSGKGITSKIGKLQRKFKNGVVLSIEPPILYIMYV